ncbi:ligand-binding sensor domain-containing protein [Paenibacillus senegalensis]|uniref:hypothetical protein n=1 Tax=Paenibacillus senegalensis TaxID=1465766 RepID=UPI0002886F86|nr:hypothetical protein [Paenibacillus senegalensis]
MNEFGSAVQVKRISGRTAGTLEELGPAIHNSTSHAASFSINGDLIYVTLDGAHGEDARLGIIDLDKESVVKLVRLPGAMGGFTMTTAEDGSIYVASYNQGNVYRYHPKTDQLDHIGRPTPETTFGYSLIPAGEGRIYGGTYPGAVFYEYDPASGFRAFGPQPFVSGEHYVRSLAHWKEAGVTYVGIGSHPYLRRYVHATGEQTELLPEKYREDDEFVYDLNLQEGKLFVRLHPSARMLVYALSIDEHGVIEEQLECELPAVSSLGVSPVHEGAVYYTRVGKLYRYELDSKTTAPLDVDTTISPYNLGLVELEDQELYPGKTLVGAGSRMGKTRLFKYNLQSGRLHLADLDIEGVPTNIQCVFAASNGGIYTGAFLVGGNSVFNPLSGQFKEYKGVGQTEAIAELGGRMYFSVYPLAKLFEYDPSRPWTLDKGGDNPRLLFNLAAEEQDRPYGLAVIGDVLYIGTICGYGKLGGSIVAYRPADGTRQVYRNPLPDLSIVALLTAGGLLYGGTTIWGGLGIAPTRTAAELLVFDPASGRAKGIPLPVPDIQALTALAAGPDGLLWGMGEGYLFAFDRQEERFVHTAHLFPDHRYGSQSVWRDASLLFGRDGSLYGTVQGTMLFRYSPVRSELELLAEDGARFLAEDREGTLYFSDGKTRLRRYTLYR